MRRYEFLRIVGAATLLYPLAVKAEQAPLQAEIYYSHAPWDGSAYEILVRLQGNSVLRINVWGNPQYGESKTFHFAGGDTQAEGGRASFQDEFNKSMPVHLTGELSFRTLKQGAPVTGSFLLKSATGAAYQGDFQARWMNRRGPGSGPHR